MAEQRAEIAILDITGVPVVDTQVAHALIQAAQAIQLLGAHIVITGIRPEVARPGGLQVELAHGHAQHAQEGSAMLAQQARHREALATAR